MTGPFDHSQINHTQEVDLTQLQRSPAFEFPPLAVLSLSAVLPLPRSGPR